MKKATKKEEKKTKIDFMPLAGRVLVKPLPEEDKKSPSGLIIPDSAKGTEEKQRGEVVAVGRGVINSDGKLVPPEVKVGDKVRFNANDWDKEKIGGEEFYLVSESSILGIIK